MSRRVVIVAPTHTTGLSVAQSLGVRPHARETIIASTPDRLRGLQITRADRVVWATPRDWPHAHYVAMTQAVALCRMGGDSHEYAAGSAGAEVLRVTLAAEALLRAHPLARLVARLSRLGARR